MRTVPAVRLPSRNYLIREVPTDYYSEYETLLDADFIKAGRRLNVLNQEMSVLSGFNTAELGNEGLRRAASYLFDPLFTTATISTSAYNVATSVRITLAINGYRSSLTSSDTVRLLQDLPLIPKR